MKPIVLVGGGETHHRLIQKINPEISSKNPITMVYDGHNKLLPYSLFGTTMAGVLRIQQARLDLWSACQKKGVYLIEDQCLNLDREEKRLHLKNYGRLDYHRLSIESQARPTLAGLSNEWPPYAFDVSSSSTFFQSIHKFFAEVHRHCPRDVRVVLTGLCDETLQMAFALQMNLRRSCEKCDIVILDQRKISKGGWVKGETEKLIEKLKPYGIRVFEEAIVVENKDQYIKLQSGPAFSYDVIIPFSHWKSTDFVGKIFDLSSGSVTVERTLRDLFDKNIFLHGRNIQFERETTGVSEIDPQEVSETLFKNLFKEDDQTPNITCRNHFKIGRYSLMPTPIAFSKWEKKSRTWIDKWHQRATGEVSHLNQVVAELVPQKDLIESLQYQADHMSHPWRGAGQSGQNYQLHAFNGFNAWGSYTQSALRICEMAILKCFTRGIEPKHLRFNLTLEKKHKNFSQHIFESTLKAIEQICEQHQITMNGGDTFDGDHWHLSVTLGGEVVSSANQRFRAHDYLIITRPLGYGFLWAGQLQDSFDSSWFSASQKEKLLIDFKTYQNFIKKWQPSGGVLVEEWGFLYHCLQSLPAHQQLNINFREIPRWEGVDSLVKQQVSHPGFDINWQRLTKDVAFSRDEVSPVNSVMWDSLSQGAIIFGVAADQWSQALEDLRQMGYSKSALVGCVRPKTKGNRIVLSDWSPS